jgi:phospholipid/cholesterol/gamma-HCH transport system ATP-binding protein
LIAVQNVSKQFGDCLALDRITVEIPLRKTTFVLGPSGHGKTVFLKTLIGLLKPDQGRIHFDGADILSFSEKELYRFWTGIGFVFQESALIDSLTVGENLSLFLTYQARLAEAEVRMKVRDLLAYVGLENMEDKFPEELSGGMKKRAAVARALVKDPRYLFFDEPTIGIDEENAKKMRELIARLSGHENRTTIIVTHDLRMMQELADFVIFIKNGAITFASPKSRVEEAQIKDLYSTETHEK